MHFRQKAAIMHDFSEITGTALPVVLLMEVAPFTVETRWSPLYHRILYPGGAMSKDLIQSLSIRGKRCHFSGLGPIISHTLKQTLEWKYRLMIMSALPAES